jgi:hypothetical protein
VLLSERPVSSRQIGNPGTRFMSSGDSQLSPKPTVKLRKT